MDRSLAAVQRRAERLGRALTTFSAEESARELRQRLLRTLLKIVDADGACFYHVGASSTGRHVTQAEAMGSDNVHRCAENMVGPNGAFSCNHTGLRDLARPSRLERSSFLEETALWDEGSFFESPPYKRILEPYRIRHQQRLLAYHGSRFLGWIGVVREHSTAPFKARQRHCLQPLVQPTITTLLTAEKLELAALPEEAGDIVLDAAGQVLHASLTGRAWLQQPRFSETLAARVRHLDQGRPASPQHCAVNRAEVRIVRLDGSDGVVYLAHVRQVGALELHPDAFLSPRQREVAHFAAAGATVPEIAEALDVSRETVRTHLREIYLRLDVSSRLELAEVLSTIG